MTWCKGDIGLYLYAAIAILTCLGVMKYVVSFGGGEYVAAAGLGLLAGLLWPITWILTILAYVAYLIS